MTFIHPVAATKGVPGAVSARSVIRSCRPPEKDGSGTLASTQTDASRVQPSGYQRAWMLAGTGMGDDDPDAIGVMRYHKGNAPAGR